MKKTLTCLIMLMVTLCATAQKDVTRFLGIPVDGSKSEMLQKLKAKGFRPTKVDKEILEGEFNGSKVNVHVVTNGDKVYRIMVSDANRVGVRDIQIRFNNLCHQFEQNEKYIAIENDRYGL